MVTGKCSNNFSFNCQNVWQLWSAGNRRSFLQFFTTFFFKLSKVDHQSYTKLHVDSKLISEDWFGILDWCWRLLGMIWTMNVVMMMVMRHWLKYKKLWFKIILHWLPVNENYWTLSNANTGWIRIAITLDDTDIFSGTPCSFSRYIESTTNCLMIMNKQW